MGKSQLHQLIAVEPDLQGESNKILSEARDTFNKRGELFRGHTKTLKMFDESRSQENVSEEKPVNETIDGKLDYVWKAFGRFVDARMQKETTNQEAKANLVVDGKILAENVPATALLALESQLKSLRDVYDKIPTLPPGTDWTEDPDSGKGIFKSKNSDKTNKTEKTIEHKVLYEATKEHPAQIEKWTSDKPVGSWETVHFSGLISPARKSSLLARIDILHRAVKSARQKANNAEVVKVQISKSLQNYIQEGNLPEKEEKE